MVSNVTGVHRGDSSANYGIQHEQNSYGIKKCNTATMSVRVGNYVKELRLGV